MSNIYVTEPPTNAKVCLKTSVGDIDIELWGKECPKAVRNFIQLCMEGYYNGTVFHRLVKEFIVQGGDPTGTGMGGDSIYGATFKDEFHSRIKFNRRGLVAMANAGKDDNGSQFFFTLGPTPELHNKHTLFGKVVGNTLFNMLKLGEGTTDKNDKPEYPNKIVGAEILVNPFDDIQPRESTKRKKEQKVDPFKSKATKNYGLLSFGDEAEEEEELTEQVKTKFDKGSKSAHDILNDEKLSTTAAVSRNEMERGDDGDDEDDQGPSNEEEKAAVLSRIRDKLKKKLVTTTADDGDDDDDGERDGDDGESSTKTKRKRKTADVVDDEDDIASLIRREAEAKKKEKIKALKNQYKKQSREYMKALRPDLQQSDEEDAPESEALADYHKVKDVYVQRQKELAKPKTSEREDKTMSVLNKFMKRLEEPKAEGSSKAKDSDSKESGAKISSQQTQKRDEMDEEYRLEVKEEEEDFDGDDWLNEPFEQATEDLPRAKDANTKNDSEWYAPNDPKHPMNRKRREGDTGMGRDRKIINQRSKRLI